MACVPTMVNYPVVFPYSLFVFFSKGDSLVLHCASLLRTIFAFLARGNELVQVHNEKNFPQAKLDSEINVPFVLNEHGDLYFFLSHNNSVHINLLN